MHYRRAKLALSFEPNLPSTSLKPIASLMSMANAKLNSAVLTSLLAQVKTRNTSYANWQMTCSNAPTKVSHLNNLYTFLINSQTSLSRPYPNLMTVKVLLLNEMESSWRAAVRRLENPGDVIERRPITMPEGLYLFPID